MSAPDKFPLFVVPEWEFLASEHAEAAIVREVKRIRRKAEGFRRDADYRMASLWDRVADVLGSRSIAERLERETWTV